MHGPEALIFIVMFGGGFAMIFGIYYLKTRENLAMLEKGFNPKRYNNRPAPYKNLKWAMLLIGAGLGLFLAYLMDKQMLRNSGYGPDENVPVYFSLIAIGGGLGLFASYRMEKKWYDENRHLWDEKNTTQKDPQDLV